MVLVKVSNYINHNISLNYHISNFKGSNLNHHDNFCEIIMFILGQIVIVMSVIIYTTYKDFFLDACDKIMLKLT